MTKYTAKKLSQSTFNLPLEQLAHNAIRVRLFGPLELENLWGTIKECHGQKSALLLLLKYLLLEPHRAVSGEEIMQNPWRDYDEDAVAARVRLRRLREMLAPMHLDGIRGLVSFSAGKYFLNPEYDLLFDADAFLSLVDKIEHISNADPEGIELCKQALELYRGRYMECTKNAPWLMKQRAIYHEKFCKLGRGLISRMRTLGTVDALPMLWQRAATVAPEEEQLHREIIGFLVELKQQEQLERYMHMLAQSGAADWLKETAAPAPRRSKTKARGQVLSDAETIHVKLFGTVEISNSNGRVVENTTRQVLPFLLLKYLLLEPEREIDINEMMTLWPPSKNEEDTERAARVRLRRAREALHPLNLPKDQKLICSRKKRYGINPAYTLERDVDQFENLKEQIIRTPHSKPSGLALCVQALELYRGPLLENTKPVSWLDNDRRYYHDTFCQVARETWERIKLLGDNQAMALLCQRTAVIIPEDEQFHKEIAKYLVERDMERELVRYYSLLAASGKAAWLKSI